MRQHETGVSRERAEYLSRRRRRKRRVLGCQIGILAAFLSDYFITPNLIVRLRVFGEERCAGNGKEG